MHPTIVYDHGDKQAEERAVKAFNDIINIAQDIGGTASGEHGIGSIKLHSAIRENSEKVLDLQREIKRVFDPKGILNPGKKIP